MSSPVMNYIDDKDLDDAVLWAAIDSASASSLSLSLSTKPRKPTPSPHVQLPKCPRTSPDLQGPCKQPKSARFTSPLSLAKMKVSSPVYGSPDSRLIAVNDFKRSESPTMKFDDGDGGRDDDNAVMHCLSGRFPTVSLFKEYQNAAMAILEKSDYTMISGHPFIKKTGWRKISCYFNMSYEIRDKTIEFDEDRNVTRAEFVVRAFMQGGRFSDGWGSCERREKRFSKPNHDIPSTAETRAKNKACQVGCNRTFYLDQWDSNCMIFGIKKQKKLQPSSDNYECLCFPDNLQFHAKTPFSTKSETGHS